MLEFENIKELKSIISDSKKKKTKHISVFQSIFRMIVFLIAYGIIMVLVTVFTYHTFSHKAKIIKMPNVINKNFLESYMILHNLNLNVKVRLKNYNNIPYGVVVSQSIAPTKLVKEKRFIALTVSQGKNQIVLPSVSSNELEYRSLYIVFEIPYNLPPEIKTNQNNTNLNVSVYISDEDSYNNELIYNETANLGDTIKIPVKATGKIKEQIFINKKLFLEREE